MHSAHFEDRALRVPNAAANQERLLALAAERYERYRYPFIYGYPPERWPGISGIIRASAVICEHLALVRRLIATDAAVRAP